MITYIMAILCFLLLIAIYIALFRFPLHRIVKSKWHLESIFDSIPDPIAIIDENRKLLRVNRAYSKIAQKPYQYIIGSRCHELFPNTKEVCEECGLEQALQSNATIQLPPHSIEIDGQTRYYNFHFFPLHNEDTAHSESVTEYVRDTTEEMVAKQKLQETKDNLQEAYNFLNEEMNLAKEIQNSILPMECPDIEGAKIIANYVPVDSVGGDLYDFVPLGNYRLGIFLGDVSGHGLPAAFVGAMTKMSLYTHSRANLSPKNVLERINDDLNRNISTGHYLTGVYGILDLNENSFRFTRASHPTPLLIQADRSRLPLDTSGIFIGMVDDAQYGEETVYLQPGDRIYFFTDGFYEYHTPQQNMMGFERFADILTDTNQVPIQEVSKEIENRVGTFYDYAKLDDDRSLIVLEVTEKSRKERFRLLGDFSKQEDIAVATFSLLPDGEGYISMILREMDKLGYEDENIRRMKVILTELFSNAIEHGNQGDSAKKVDIAWAVDPEKVKVACIDEGPGFQLSEVPDPTAPENIMKDRGRGLHIIRSFVDEILQNEKGNRLTIIKHKNKKQ